MRAMERALLEKILDATEGIDRGDGSAFEVADEHRASLYLGGGQGTTVVGDLVSIVLHDDYIQATAKDNTRHCILYEPVFGMSLKVPREKASRTGFG